MEIPSLKKAVTRSFLYFTQRSPAYLLFWIKRRVGQRWIDPRWIAGLNEEIQKREVPQKLLYKKGWDISSDGHEILDALSTHANQNFFFGKEDRAVIFRNFPQRFPENAANLIEEASDLLRGRVHYAGEIFEIGDKPDWYAPHLHPEYSYFLQLNALEAFHWLKILGKAYWLTNNKAYADHAKKWLTLWLDDIPNHFDSEFWKDTNYTGTRALNLLSGLIFFSEAWDADTVFVQKILGQIYLHGSLLERRLEYPGANHLMWQIHDLVLLGLALEPVFECAGAWQKKALTILEQQISRQYFPDGINFELSIGYNVFVTKLVGEVISNFWKAGKPLPPQIVWRFKQSLHALKILRRPDKKLPLYGDAYRSHDSNLEGATDEMVPTLWGLGERLFPEKNKKPEHDSPLLPWMMGKIYSWKGGNPSQKTFQHGAPESGVVVLKAASEGVENNILYVCMQAGQSLQGQVHAHADTLSLELADRGGAILVDPGAYYENSGPLRSYFRSTLAHNTIRVNWRDISQVSETFHMWPHTCGRVVGCFQNELATAVEALHTSYRRLPGSVLHTRAVMLWQSKYLIILDELTGKGAFGVERMFHFAPGELKKIPDGWRWQKDNRVWTMVNVSTADLKEEVVVGREDPPLGWYAEYRGKRVESPTFKQEGNVVGALRCMTVLTPDGAGPLQVKINSTSHQPESGAFVFQFHVGNLLARSLDGGCEMVWYLP